jgi:hypothetical protein
MPRIELPTRAALLLIAGALFALPLTTWKPARSSDGPAMAQESRVLAQTCARRDLELVTLIEQLGDAGAVAGPMLHEATLTVLTARKACDDQGDVQGLSIYERLGRRLAAAVAAD